MEGFVIYGCNLILSGRCSFYEPSCGAVSTRGTPVFVPVLLELWMYGIISYPGIGSYPARATPALRTPGWIFHAVRGGIDPGDYHARPRYAGVVKI